MTTATTYPVRVFVEKSDPAGTVRATSKTSPGRSYAVTEATSLYPKCPCLAGQNNRECDHVIAVLDWQRQVMEAFGVEPPEEEVVTQPETIGAPARALVPIRATAAVAQRAANTRRTLLEASGGINEAIAIAKVQRAMWPKDLQDAVDQEEAAQTAGVCVYMAAALGIDPMMAFSYIAPIQNKPFVMAKMVNALVRSRVPGGRINVTRRENDVATAVAHRPGEPDVEVTVTIADAARAGWMVRRWYDKQSREWKESAKDNWKNTPAAMLAARAITTAGWLQFADILAGMDAYDVDEDEVMLSNDAAHSHVRVVVEQPARDPRDTTATEEDAPLDGDYSEMSEPVPAAGEEGTGQPPAASETSPATNGHTAQDNEILTLIAEYGLNLGDMARHLGRGIGPKDADEVISAYAKSKGLPVIEVVKAAALAKETNGGAK